MARVTARISTEWIASIMMLCAPLVLASCVSNAGAPIRATTVATVNMRAAPSAGSAVVTTVPDGVVVVLYGCRNEGWCDVSLGERRGWVTSRSLAFEPAGTVAATPVPVFLSVGLWAGT
jgi:uncharacterized protein YraI